MSPGKSESRQVRDEAKERKGIVRVAFLATIMFLSMTTTTQANLIPRDCHDALAPRLCAIHKHRAKANELRSMMGQSRLGYHWRAERYPALRDKILHYWTQVHKTTVGRWQALLPSSVKQVLLCIHPHEEPAWNTVAGGLGYVYAPSSYIATVGSRDKPILAAFVRHYGNRWPAWPRSIQLRVGAMLVRVAGYQPWSTRGYCT
jgi:hypothetical protein